MVRDGVRWVALVAVVIGLAAVAGVSGGVADSGLSAQVAGCTASPALVEPGQTVTLDASSSDASAVEFDTQGDGSWDRVDDMDFIVDVVYQESGTYDPQVRAIQGESADIDLCGQVNVTEFPTAALTVSPQQAVTGQSVSFDASGSTDPDGSLVEYRWDFDSDGEIDRTTSTPTTTFKYSEPGPYVGSVTVVDDAGATDTVGRDVSVRPGPLARCTVEPASASPGETVLIDATGSENADLIDYDTDGDSEYDEFEESEFTLETTAGDTTFTPRVRVYQEDSGRANVTECGTVTVQEPNEPPEPVISVSPRPGVVGQQSTFDASNSVDPDGQIVEYRWDWEGDGTVDRTTSQPTTTYAYQQVGSYLPMVTVVDDDNASRIAETNYRVDEPVGELRCAVEPATVAPGEEVQIDASDSSSIDTVGYDTDGDGEYERPEETSLVVTVAYEEPGTYQPQVRDPISEQVVDCGVVTVEENEPPRAAFSPSASEPAPGQRFTLDASNSTDPDGQVVEYRWDLDGDGTVDRRSNGPQIQVNFSQARLYTVLLTVADDDGATDSTSRDISVVAEPPGDGDGGIPWIPIGAGGLAGLGGLLYYVFRDGGGSPGGGSPGGDSTPKPKPKRTPSTDDRLRYETGVFALPTASGTVSVPVGFEPDLLLFSVVNSARTDPAIDRTAGASFGTVHRTDEGLTNQCQTVADDAQHTDQATCAIAEDRALQLVRHSSSDPPGRVTGRVTSTASTGFDLEVSIPGDDPLAGGVRVLYQAFSTPTDVDTEVGFFETPTEPGTQAVEFGFEADHVSLTASAAVSDTDQLWTTNRGVGLSVGNAISGDRSVEQTVWGTSAWPETDHATAAVCDIDRSLYLLYQDGDRIAGRTRGAVTSLGSRLRLQYDRVYNGPQKLGSTARHPVSYLAIAGGEQMRPAVGAVTFPRDSETLNVDCGFEPAMVELFVTGAPIGDEVAGGASSRPFDISHGTAIDTGDGLRQYVLHHSVRAEPPAARSDVPAGDGATGDTGETAADGGQRQEQSEGGSLQDVGETGQPSEFGELAGDDVGEIPTDGPVGDVPSQGPADDSPDQGGDTEAPDPKATTDDGRAGLWLPQAADGTILGRDELQVQALTEQGFEVTARRFDTDGRTGSEPRPSVVYRAWPAADGKQGGRSTDDGDGASRDEATDAGDGRGTAGADLEATEDSPSMTTDLRETESNT